MTLKSDYREKKSLKKIILVLEKSLIFHQKFRLNHGKWPNKHPLPIKRLLSNKCPLYAVKIVLDAPLQ